MIIIMRFRENNVLCPKYIDIYEFQGVWRGRTYSTVHFLFIIKKNVKSTRAWAILKSDYTSFWFNKFFPRMNNKNFTKRGPKGAPLLFLYKVSIVVLINFIAILNSMHLFNTNMYLIDFNSKNSIKMHFPQNMVFKFQTHFSHSISIAARWNKLCWHQQRLPNSVALADLKKKLINNYKIYS